VAVRVTHDIEKVLGREPRALNEFFRNACGCTKAAAS
jgi:hypothetical protein